MSKARRRADEEFHPSEFFDEIPAKYDVAGGYYGRKLLRALNRADAQQELEAIRAETGDKAVEAALAVIRCGTQTKAAEVLGITPAAISQRIKRLCDRYPGVRLSLRAQRVRTPKQYDPRDQVGSGDRTRLSPKEAKRQGITKYDQLVNPGIGPGKNDQQEKKKRR